MRMKINFHDICPICDYKIERCQCKFGGSCHPIRDKERKVVFDHLYLFSKKQITHLIKLQEFWRISYSDKELSKINDNYHTMYDKRCSNE